MSSGNPENGKNDLQSKYEFNSRWADRIARLILLGLAVDILAAFILGKSAPEIALTIIANALILAGVWGELWFEKRAKAAGDGIVAEANARAAEADARAAEAHAELARLQKKLEPRAITVDGEAKINEALRSYRGLPFFVKADPAAEYAFVNRLIAVLQRAGWKWMGYGVSPMTLPTGDFDTRELDESLISGVQVRINRSKANEWHDAAKTLGFALTETMGASTPILVDPPDSPLSCSSDAIQVEIARKL